MSVVDELEEGEEVGEGEFSEVMGTYIGESLLVIA